MIKLDGINCCEHCGEEIKSYDDATIRDNKLYHDDCLPENLDVGEVK